MRETGKHPIVRRGVLLSGAGLISLYAYATPACAQAQQTDQVETVTVTAEKRAENVQNVPMAITAFSGDQMEQEDIVSFEDLARITPNVQFTSANITRNTTVTVRNQGTSGTNPGFDQDVGLFVDGVYIPAAGAILNDLIDVSTVEVLRGPQGTLYGRNTPVGDINVTTRAPTDDFEAMVEGQIGNFGEEREAGYVNLPISDDLSSRFTVWHEGNTGDIKNLYTGNDVNSIISYGGRGRVRWTPDDRTTVDFIGYYGKVGDHGIYPAQINPYGKGGIIGLIGSPLASYSPSSYNFQAAWSAQYPGTVYKPPGKFQTDDGNGTAYAENAMYGASVNASRELPFGATLTNILAYNFNNDDVKNTAVNGLPLSPFQNYAQPNRDGSSSDELRIVSPGHQFIDYVAGVYLYHEDTIYDTFGTYGPAATIGQAIGADIVGESSYIFYKMQANDVAAYTQDTIELTDQFRLNGGLRYSVDHKDASFTAYNVNPYTDAAHIKGYGLLQSAIQPPLTWNPQDGGERDDHALTWQLGAQYDLSEHVMAYFTMATGFKDGGFNSRVSNPAYSYSVAPENTLNYELGEKGTFFDGKLLLNVDVYRMLIHGRQVSELDPTITTLFDVYNAGDIRQEGVEADLQARPIDHLSINGDLAYTSSVFSSFPNATCVNGLPFGSTATHYETSGLPQPNPAYNNNLCNQTGFTPANSPKWTWALGARWEDGLRDTHFQWFVSGDVQYEGGQYEDPSLDPRSYQSAYVLLNATLGFEPESGQWHIQLYGKNLTNQGYFLSEAALGASGLMWVSGAQKSPAGFMGFWGQPRTYGIEASYKF